MYGGAPPLACTVVVMKLLTNTLLPAPMPHTPPHVKNCALMASAGLVPVPVPLSAAVCGLPALSVTVSAADRVREAVGL